MIKDGRRPMSAGGIREPLRLGGSGAREGRFSRITSIFGGSPGAGGCILGIFGLSSYKSKQCISAKVLIKYFC